MPKVRFKEEQRILMSGPVEIILRTPLMVEEELKEPVREPAIRLKPKRRRRKRVQKAISGFPSEIQAVSSMSGFGNRGMGMGM